MHECNNRLIKLGDISKGMEKKIAKKVHSCSCHLNFFTSKDLDQHMEHHNGDQDHLQLDDMAESADILSNDSGFLDNVIKKKKNLIVKQRKKRSKRRKKRSRRREKMLNYKTN